jgi:hypothetical protein
MKQSEVLKNHLVGQKKPKNTQNVFDTKSIENGKKAKIDTKSIENGKNAIFDTKSIENDKKVKTLAFKSENG